MKFVANVELGSLNARFSTHHLRMTLIAKNAMIAEFSQCFVPRVTRLILQIKNLMFSWFVLSQYCRV